MLNNCFKIKCIVLNKAFVALLLLLLFSTMILSNSHAMAIIVNESVSSPPTSTKELRNIYTLQTLYWANGKKIQVFVYHDDNPIHQEFAKTITQIFPHQYRRIWDRVTFSGTGVAPKMVESKDEMLEKISQTENSIGYIDTITEYNNIKIISPQSLQGDSNE